MSEYHIPVLLNEVLQFLEIKPGSWYVDCNLGGGGHTKGILEAGGKVIGIDLDPDAIHQVAKDYDLKIEDQGDHLEAYSENLILYQSNFANIDQVVNVIARNEVTKQSKTEIASPSVRNDRMEIQGILFDLGVSTHQLETDKRGFSFNLSGPLDMRMNPNQSVSAKELVNGLYERELADLFWRLGEERFSRQIAKKIVEQRTISPIETSDQLVQIILSVRHRSPKDKTHPATRVFQALRIAVNDELNSLTEALPKALEILSPEGKLAVIAFHSLEDRIVKNYFRDWEKENKVKILTKKPIEPTEVEINSNPRSRSGKLRVLEKS